MDDASIGVTIIGEEGRYLKVNAAFCAMTGYSEAELVGRSVKDITYEKDRDELHCFCNGILDGTVKVSKPRSVTFASRERFSGRKSPSLSSPIL